MSHPPFFLGAAEEQDLEALLALERRCFNHPWTARNFTDAMDREARGRVLVLRAPAARGHPSRGILAYCVFQAVAGEMHIHNLGVDPDQRRRGLGRRLLELTLRAGRQRGARAAFLEVRVGNAEALRLYHSLGFRKVSVRRGYYQHPREDALLLRADL